MLLLLLSPLPLSSLQLLMLEMLFRPGTPVASFLVTLVQVFNFDMLFEALQLLKTLGTALVLALQLPCVPLSLLPWWH
jgi:hypothetical protein